jgi:hypothetical protein
VRQQLQRGAVTGHQPRVVEQPDPAVDLEGVAPAEVDVAAPAEVQVAVVADHQPPAGTAGTAPGVGAEPGRSPGPAAQRDVTPDVDQAAAAQRRAPGVDRRPQPGHGGLGALVAPDEEPAARLHRQGRVAAELEGRQVDAGRRIQGDVDAGPDADVVVGPGRPRDDPA